VQQYDQRDGGQEGQSYEDTGGSEEFHTCTLLAGRVIARRPSGAFRHPSEG
jgi:hypothetical protein